MINYGKIFTAILFITFIATIEYIIASLCSVYAGTISTCKIWYIANCWYLILNGTITEFLMISLYKNEFHGRSEFNCFQFIPGVSGDDVSEDVVPDVSVGDESEDVVADVSGDDECEDVSPDVSGDDVNGIEDVVVIESIPKS